MSRNCFKRVAGRFVMIFFLFFFVILIYSKGIKKASAFLVLPIRSISHPPYISQEVLVEFASWINLSDIQNILQTINTRGISKLHPNKNIYRVKFALPISVEKAIEILESSPLVKYAEPNYYVEAELIPNDPIYIYQWHMGIINMQLAWDINNGAGAIVAVLDTGVAYRDALPYAQAPDLAGTIFLPGYDFVNDDPYPDDDNGHGTHIVGTIAQTTNNLLGCAGIAYGCSIMPLKVLDANSNGLLSDVVAGFYFAVDNGAQIINTSFGTLAPSLSLEDAVNYAALNGVTIVCSAGNAASSAPHYPSSYPACISVSAIMYDKTLAFYSNYGADIDLCAPGGNLVYDQNLDGKPDGIVQQTHNGIDFLTFNYYILQGTSCAAAHVTGTAALIIGASGGSLGADQVRSYMETTAQDLGTLGWDQYFGWGLVDAFASLAALPLIAVVASTTPLQPIPNQIITPPFSVSTLSFSNHSLIPLEINHGLFFTPINQKANPFQNMPYRSPLQSYFSYTIPITYYNNMQPSFYIQPSPISFYPEDIFSASGVNYSSMMFYPNYSPYQFPSGPLPSKLFLPYNRLLGMNNPFYDILTPLYSFF